jgi:8-oxo-dGTP diphosphatase
MRKDLGLVLDEAAANEPGQLVEGVIRLAEVEGDIAAGAEIAELLWIDPDAPPPVRLAPLLQTRVLPALGISGTG